MLDRSRARRAGFTLIELLVVIGVIVVLIGAGAMALAGRGGEGAALANGQNLVASMVGAARAQAALHQTNARLVIYAQRPPGQNVDSMKYLRTIIVVRQETNARGGNVWVAAGDPVTLPAPISIVPPPPVPTNHLRAGVTWNNNRNMGPVSTALQTLDSFSYASQSNQPANRYFGTTRTNGRVHFLQFAADGTVTTGQNPSKIALTTAVLAANALPQFNNNRAVRGLLIRRTGAISLVDESTGF
ncbi:MAG: prepilin-type N-terminal cleavage/methylation domain-containing protein [Opitutaceae bacterium]|nr:prepilin-type N-terminal cleavage/methylation domain-containing protein [Opitutaceae bacterium]